MRTTVAQVNQCFIWTGQARKTAKTRRGETFMRHITTITASQVTLASQVNTAFLLDVLLAVLSLVSRRKI